MTAQALVGHVSLTISPPPPALTVPSLFLGSCPSCPSWTRSPRALPLCSTVNGCQGLCWVVVDNLDAQWISCLFLVLLWEVFSLHLTPIPWGSSRAGRQSSFIHYAANTITSFFLMAEKYSTVCMYHIFFIHSSVSGHLGCFHVLALVNSPAVNTAVCVFFSIMVFWGYMPSSGIARSYGIFCFLRNLHTVPYNGCINLHSHQQYRKFPFSQTLSSNIDFLMRAILTSVRIPHFSFDLYFAYNWWC